MVFCCRITIESAADQSKKFFDAASSIEIEKTWRKFTNTAVLQLPKGVYYQVGNTMFPMKSIKSLFKTGDLIKIELGYNRELKTEFEGYIARIQPTIPVEFHCENEMYALKRKEVTVSIQNATVRQILQAAAPGYEIECADELYGDFSLYNTTPVKVFDELRKKAGLYTFFRGKRLICGLPYSDDKLPTVIPQFEFGRNIIDNSLEYIAPEDCKVKVYGTSIQNDGSVISFDIGDEGGDIERVKYEFQISKEELEKTCKKKYDNVKTKGGYAGTVTSFGFPVVEHGQTIRVFDPGIYEKRDSMHYVDQVKISVSVSGGYRRVSTVGKFVTEKKLLK
ncbi:hypothetical protein [Flavobacterium algoritolerans]|uniref:Phage protein D n=1 Tax=Flavobacterium algoritolerans TaxID=3041254 RepID=A0ABT6V860_9FLAO|nr:hypothetical protein [Flavobacterium algoritolerans]MDI5894400.1 hypothetical protein [Flavobacterium algoritolerans]